MLNGRCRLCDPPHGLGPADNSERPDDAAPHRLGASSRFQVVENHSVSAMPQRMGDDLSISGAQILWLRSSSFVTHISEAPLPEARDRARGKPLGRAPAPNATWAPAPRVPRSRASTIGVTKRSFVTRETAATRDARHTPGGTPGDPVAGKMPALPVGQRVSIVATLQPYIPGHRSRQTPLSAAARWVNV